MNGGITKLHNLLVSNIINPLLYLLFAVGLLIFVFGMVEFIYGLNAETDARERGKKHMLWGLVGMLIMAVAYSIVRLIIDTVGARVPGVT